MNRAQILSATTLTLFAVLVGCATTNEDTTSEGAAAIGEVKVTVKTVKVSLKTDSCTLDIEAPQIVVENNSAATDAITKALPSPDPKDLCPIDRSERLDIRRRYELKTNARGVLSLLIQESRETDMTTHIIHEQTGYTFEAGSGKPVAPLKDLLTVPGFDDLKRACSEEAETTLCDAATGEPGNFTVEDGGIRLVFNEIETLVVPWSIVGARLKPGVVQSFAAPRMTQATSDCKADATIPCTPSVGTELRKTIADTLREQVRPQLAVGGVVPAASAVKFKFEKLLVANGSAFAIATLKKADGTTDYVFTGTDVAKKPSFSNSLQAIVNLSNREVVTNALGDGLGADVLACSFGELPSLGTLFVSAFDTSPFDLCKGR